jgi:hypothetical protein
MYDFTDNIILSLFQVLSNSVWKVWDKDLSAFEQRCTGEGFTIVQSDCLEQELLGRDNSTVQVYQVVPEDASEPYILLTNPTQLSNEDKTRTGAEVTIEVQCVVPQNGSGNNITVNALADQVLRLIKPKESYNIPSSSHAAEISVSYLDFQDYFIENPKTGKTITKWLRFRFHTQSKYLNT